MMPGSLEEATPVFEQAQSPAWHAKAIFVLFVRFDAKVYVWVLLKSTE
jgi:hypothetical protein